MTSKAIRSVTSSPVLRDGLSPSKSPVLRQLRLFGPEAVRASHLATLGPGKEKATRDTSGQISPDLSPSAALQLSLESRLRQRLGVFGSPEYVTTWKRWAMPSGVPICAQRASARHILGSGCIGWPTLIKRDGATLLRARRAPNATGSEPMAWVAGLVTGVVKENRDGLKMEVPVGLNPEWACWLMGFPVAWLLSVPLAMQSSRS